MLIISESVDSKRMARYLAEETSFARAFPCHSKVEIPNGHCITTKQNKTLTIYAFCCNESHRFIPVVSLLFAISDLNVNLKLDSCSLFLVIRHTPFALIVKPNISAKYVANTSALLLMPNMFALLYVVQSIALLYNINWDTIVGF